MNDFKFYKVPFAFLTFFFISGLWIGNEYFNWDLALILILISIFFFLLEWNFRTIIGDSFSRLIIPSILFTMGYWSIYLSERKNYSIESFTNKPVTIEFSIKEIAKSNSGYSKGIGIIHQVSTSDYISNTEELFLFYIDSSVLYNKGDRLISTSKLIPIENKGNPGEFNQKQYWKNQNIRLTSFLDKDDTKWIDYDEPSFFNLKISELHHYLGNVLKTHLQGQELALASALILGDKSMLDKETKSSFSATGSMHVLAVSGMHIAIILELLLFISSFFYRIISKQKATLLIVMLLWIYALLTGFSPSVIRAVFTFSILAIAQLTGKNYNPINTLFFTAFVLLVLEPHFFFDIGFQLSYLAMLGIYLTYNSISSWYYSKNKVINFFWKGTALGFSAQVLTIPMMLYYFHQFPNYFILSNLILMILSGVILGGGILLFVTWKVPILNSINATILFVSLYLSLVSLKWIEGLPGAVAYGYNFPFVVVPILTLSSIFLIKFSTFKNYWIFSACIFWIGLGWIVLLRYETMTSNHLVIFNNSKLTFAIKNNDEIHFFVDAPQDEFYKSIYIADAYLKCYPGNVTWHSIKNKNGTFLLGKDTLEWKSLSGEKLIKWNGKKINVQYSSSGEDEKVDHFMPWIEHRKSLKHGAVIYE